jgi:anti-anti-sigma factor
LTTLELRQDVRGSAVVIAVAGDIDTDTVGSLVDELESALDAVSDQGPKVLVIDFDKVTYFGSAALNAVLSCFESGRADGVTVRLVASNAEVLRPLEVTQLDAVVRPYPTVSEALAEP